jgi:hypothetical protein
MGRNGSMPARIMLTPDRSRAQAQRIAEQVLLGGGQLLIAGVVAILWEFIAITLKWDESRQFPLAPAGPQIRTACTIAVLGFVSAWSVVWLFPGAARAGRWVWLPPVALLTLLIGVDIFRNGMDWQLISARYFWAYPAQMLAPILRDIFTYPALSAAAYSLGVLVRDPRHQRASGI